MQSGVKVTERASKLLVAEGCFWCCSHIRLLRMQISLMRDKSWSMYIHMCIQSIILRGRCMTFFRTPSVICILYFVEKAGCKQQVFMWIQQTACQSWKFWSPLIRTPAGRFLNLFFWGDNVHHHSEFHPNQISGVLNITFNCSAHIKPGGVALQHRAKMHHPSRFCHNWILLDDNLISGG